jgi:hypothetical protein
MYESFAFSFKLIEFQIMHGLSPRMLQKNSIDHIAASSMIGGKIIV